jgi:putative CocE/NonD family hydrolase
MHRLGLVLGICVAATAWLGGAVPIAARASGPGDTTTFTKHADVRVQINGISIDTDEYVPDKGCPCPVLLVQTPYRKNGAVGEYNPYFPAHGYAEIVADVRGTGSSEGYWDSFGVDEQQDGAALARYAAKRPFANGIVGLWGVSYGAINQLLTVEQPDTGMVKAIFPVVPEGDAYRDVVFAGGNTDTGFIPLWLGLVNSLNMQPADDAQSNPAIALNAASQHLVDVAKFAVPAVADATLGAYESQLPPQLQNFPEQAYDGPYFRTVSPLNHVEKVHVPTFIVGAEYDLFQRSEPLLYRGLDLPTSQKKLVYGPWYHGNPTSNLSADDGSGKVVDQQGNVMPSVNNLALAWYDHWLKGKDNGIDRFPTVETFQLGRGKWTSDTRFPATGTRYAPFYLSGASSGSGAQAILDGSLGRSAGAAGSAQVPWQPLTGACSRSTAQWTAGIVAASPCQDDNRTSEITGLSFTTDTFKQDFTISGPIMADLWVSSTRPDTTLIATITDVHPDGTSDRVTAGSMVASMRELTATPCGAKVMDCSLYFDGIPAVPWHPYTRSSQTALSPGVPTELKVEIFPTSLVLQPGHRLRLSITTGDLPHQGPNASILANAVGGVDTVYFGGDRASRVYLGEVSPAAAPAVSAVAGASTGTSPGGGTQSNPQPNTAAAPRARAGGNLPNTSASLPLRLGVLFLLIAAVGVAAFAVRRRRAAS